uniref:THD domain-containing protein n=1 Tax=Electrophorus electricus TaxID=8005 RepID=A0A4W4HG47_ELEEL
KILAHTRVSTYNIDAKTLELQQRPVSVDGRTAVFVALTIIGFMQVVSTVTVLLHLTGHIPQGVLNEMAPGDALRGKQRTGARSRKQKSVMPAAHLPVRPPSLPSSSGTIHATIIHWNAEQGNLQHFGYHNGRILVEESGLYYVYAKTCFRYYDIFEVSSETEHNSQSDVPLTLSPSDYGVQLMQYVFHERISHRTSEPVLLMKSGNTWRWKRGTYHMCCEQQSGVFSLQAGEGVYVSVLNLWLLDPEAEGSYFGAFRVSSEL